MYIVIGGGGRIGRHIAADMVAKGHEITIVERDGKRCERLVAETGILVIEGDVADVRYLEQAHLERANVFVATTHDDDENLVACQLAMIEFDVKRTISRVNTPKNVDIFEALGIEAVSSTRLISELLEHEFATGDLVHLQPLRGGKVELVEIRLPTAEEGGPRSRMVQDLPLPEDSVLVAIFRGEEVIIPRGVTLLDPGDIVVALTTPERADELQGILSGS
ncbi:MAG: TrkA family potassium uptake protein [Nitriliruptorales bacterium]|nr:TrkA family potassium uptake protein [Nitriliruptorales bacterium]